jgi:hypothetical protein
MFSQAMVCDVCQYTALVDPGDAILMDDLTVPPGWVRLYANRPNRFNWDSATVSSSIEMAVDCCSISCAQEELLRHSKDITARQVEADEIRKSVFASE